MTMILHDYEEQQRRAGISERQFAAGVGVPRTTLQYWRRRKASLSSSPVAVAFFESPEGVELLHRFNAAAHLVMVWMGNCGIRLLSVLIELTGLGPFIAGSYGAQQAFSAEMQSALVEFGDEERKSREATFWAG